MLYPPSRLHTAILLYPITETVHQLSLPVLLEGAERRSNLDRGLEDKIFCVWQQDVDIDFAKFQNWVSNNNSDTETSGVL